MSATRGPGKSADSVGEKTSAMAEKTLDISDRPEDHIFCRDLDCINKLQKCHDMETPERESNEIVDEPSNDEVDSLLFKTALEELDCTLLQDLPDVCNSVHIVENNQLYRPELPFQLGVIVPGVKSTFSVSVHPGVRTLKVQCYLNDRPTKFPCEISSMMGHMSVSLTPPSAARGDLVITIDTDSGSTIKLAASCFPPAFALPPILVVPPNQRALIPLHGSFPKSIWLTVKSNLSAPKIINFTPEMRNIPLEIKATPEDKYLKVEIFHDGVLVSTSEEKIQVRVLDVTMTVGNRGDSITIRNNEPFTVKLDLEADTETPLQKLVLNLKSGDCHRVEKSHFRKRWKSKNLEMKLWLKLTQPLEVLIGSSCLSESRTHSLRPTVPQFTCLSSGVTQFSMVDKNSGEPRPWKGLVAIEPCKSLEHVVKVEENPEDPANVVLRVAKPENLVFGRLGFFDWNSRGAPLANPHGSRYIFVVPEKPQLIIVTPDQDTTDDSSGKKQLLLENISKERVFLRTETGEILILAGGTSTKLTMRNGNRIWVGLDDLRCIVREKLTRAAGMGNDGIVQTLETSQLMIRFREEPKIDYSHILDQIPDRPDSLRKLHDFLESTLEGVILSRNPDGSAETLDPGS